MLLCCFLSYTIFVPYFLSPCSCLGGFLCTPFWFPTHFLFHLVFGHFLTGYGDTDVASQAKDVKHACYLRSSAISTLPLPERAVLKALTATGARAGLSAWTVYSGH